MVKFEVKQEATYESKDWWKWAVWIEGQSKDLKRIASVTYTLHPTFAEPIRTSKELKTKFKIQDHAWGEFQINICLQLSGGKSITTGHWLVLRYPHGQRANQKAPVVYISSSMADADAASALREVLKAHVKVLTSEDISPDLPAEFGLRKIVERSNVSVAIVSDATSSFVEREVSFLTAHDLPVIPVIRGPMAKIPDPLHGLQSINMKDMSDVKEVAGRILNEIKSRAIWE
jgi:hypothetical protein